jgi:hypothetical protein
MKLATTSLFVAILVNPLPGGGKVPAIGQAETFQIDQTQVLAIVLIVSILQIALLIHAADLLKRGASRLSERTGRTGPTFRVPEVGHPLLRYVVIAGLPLLPAGGGMLWSVGLSHAWRLDRTLSVALISISNWVSFMCLYLLAGTFGLLTFFIGFAGMLGVWYLARWSNRWIRSHHFGHA